ncbi:MAG: hypothetical protein MZV70_24135 [Desulfobacterales bacterium]|nr:hypothetical protein [Desulfobacterales bacterium]
MKALYFDNSLPRIVMVQAASLLYRQAALMSFSPTHYAKVPEPEIPNPGGSRCGTWHAESVVPNSPVSDGPLARCGEDFSFQGQRGGHQDRPRTSPSLTLSIRPAPFTDLK